MVMRALTRLPYSLRLRLLDHLREQGITPEQLRSIAARRRGQERKRGQITSPSEADPVLTAAVSSAALLVRLSRLLERQSECRELRHTWRARDWEATAPSFANCYWAIQVSRRTRAGVDARRGRGRVGSQPGGGLTLQSGCPDGSAFQNMILSK